MEKPETKIRAGRNRTLTLNQDEIPLLRQRILYTETLKPAADVLNKTINGDIIKTLPLIPDNFANLIIIDPPYNLTKNYNGTVFNSRTQDSY